MLSHRTTHRVLHEHIALHLRRHGLLWVPALHGQWSWHGGMGPDWMKDLGGIPVEPDRPNNFTGGAEADLDFEE